MPVDFHLGPTEAATRAAAAGFAQNVLKPARAEYLKYTEHSERFQATQPAYAAAVQGGLLKGQISPAHGGNGGSLVEAAIMVEECYSVEPSAALTIFVCKVRPLTKSNTQQTNTHSPSTRPPASA